ncbi:MAG: Rdx family protein [Roseiflexaceae bacterium]
MLSLSVGADARLRDELASIKLIPWQDGAFDVVVDGELVHSMYRDGGFPASATIIDAVRGRLAA